MNSKRFALWFTLLGLLGAIGSAPAQEKDFVPLFNGKDLTGWKTHPKQPGQWKVQDKLLTGSGPVSHLFSEQGDFEDFHVRAEFRIPAKGNSGLYFRSDFGLGGLAKKGGPAGYEAQILHQDPPISGNTTGALPRFQKGKDTFIKPGEWATVEVIAKGSHIVIKVNGETTVDFMDSNKTYSRGHFALQQYEEGSFVQFRKIEVKVLKTSEVVKKPLPYKTVPLPKEPLPPLGAPKLLPSGLYPQEELMLKLINDFRVANGLQPRKINMTMCLAARKHSENMARQDKLDHVLDGKGPGDRAAAAGLKGGFGENCAGGSRGPVGDYFEGWVGSPDHRKNLLSDRAEMGVGFAVSAGGNVHWYTGMFGDKQ